MNNYEEEIVLPKVKEDPNELLADIKKVVDNVDNHVFLIYNRTNDLFDIKHVVERTLDIDGFDDSLFGQIGRVYLGVGDIKKEIPTIERRLDSILDKLDSIDSKFKKIEKEIDDLKDGIKDINKKIDKLS